MMIRSFVAIEMPHLLQQAITKHTFCLHEALPRLLIRWVPESNIHLTLIFLGSVSSTNLKRLAENLKEETSQRIPFTISIGGLGIFPNNRQPRVIWIGIDAPIELRDLHQNIEIISARMGYPTENRPFSPHLTIGRFNQHISNEETQKIHTMLDQINIGYLGSVCVESIVIFKSDLKPTLLFTAES